MFIIKRNFLIHFIISCYILTIILPQISADGTFELRILSFINHFNRDLEGNCCESDDFTKSQELKDCTKKCSTYFRICLKEYQVNIENIRCTFGEKFTPVLNMSEPLKLPQTLLFKFNFTWTRTFSLIIEAWHSSSSSRNSGSKKLLSRLAIQKSLDADSRWTKGKYITNATRLEYSYRVVCDLNFFGEKCSKFCKPRDDKYGHFDCDHSGGKLCHTGWKDEYCSTPICLPGCKGSCSKPNECQCRIGWTGELCDKCLTYPGCIHGTCKMPWECECKEGWGGLYCNQDLNYCTTNSPCKNNGTCANSGQGSYTCTCKPNFTGRDCEISIDVCSTSPCLNGGKCIPANTAIGYTCQCELGYVGQHCEKIASECVKNPCKNGATCSNGPSGYMCICTPAYEGSDCSIKKSSCSQNPCGNGTCLPDPVTDYKCSCRAGFDGVHCERNIDDCAPNSCLNGGKCIDGINTFECLCLSGFVGEQCEISKDPCLTSPCENGGTCYSLANNNFKCLCPPGFTGKNCFIDINECENSPCLNGGTCKDGVNGYNCTCSSGFIGARCELSLNEISHESSDFNKLSSLKNSSVENSENFLGQAERIEHQLKSLSTEQILYISILSAIVPICVIIGACVMLLVKKSRLSRIAKEKHREEEEMRRQNEANANMKKCLDSGFVFVNNLEPRGSMGNLNRVKNGFKWRDNGPWNYDINKWCTMRTKTQHNVLNNNINNNNNVLRPVKSMILTDYDNESKLYQAFQLSKESSEKKGYSTKEYERIDTLENEDMVKVCHKANNHK